MKIRCLWLSVLALCLAASAFAVSTDTRLRIEGKGTLHGDGVVGDPRQGGDTFADAVVIPSLPYCDSGATCGYNDDYLACGSAGAGSPDVVYVYTSPVDQTISLDLCDSGFDTKLYVYVAGPVLVACNDDACGDDLLRSRIISVSLQAGVDYYVVVDGYGGDCGSYTLCARFVPPCVIPCPDGALEEGEPPCTDNYVDMHNGGCGSSNYSWTLILPQQESCATMCGKSCTYLYDGFSYRDTDWYRLYAEGGQVTVTGRAEFPLLLILIYIADCASMDYEWVQADPCVPASLSRSFAQGEEFWIWVGPSVFNGIPESDYVLDVCGIAQAPSPVQKTGWGRIKQIYR